MLGSVSVGVSVGARRWGGARSAQDGGARKRGGERNAPPPPPPPPRWEVACPEPPYEMPSLSGVLVEDVPVSPPRPPLLLYPLPADSQSPPSSGPVPPVSTCTPPGPPTLVLVAKSHVAPEPPHVFAFPCAVASPPSDPEFIGDDAALPPGAYLEAPPPPAAIASVSSADDDDSHTTPDAPPPEPLDRNAPKPPIPWTKTSAPFCAASPTLYRCTANFAPLPPAAKDDPPPCPPATSSVKKAPRSSATKDAGRGARNAPTDDALRTVGGVTATRFAEPSAPRHPLEAVPPGAAVHDAEFIL